MLYQPTRTFGVRKNITGFVYDPATTPGIFFWTISKSQLFDHSAGEVWKGRRPLQTSPATNFMLRFILRRIAGLIFVLLGVSVITFALSQLVPIDPAASALGQNAREEQILAYRQELGLDRPAVVQYFSYVGRLLQGDLGKSICTRRAVADDLRDFFPATLELSIAAMIVALVLGISLGIVAAISAQQPGGWGGTRLCAGRRLAADLLCRAADAGAVL